MNTSTVRPVKILDESAESFQVANFFFEKIWWRAVVPKNQVREVYYQIVPFDSGVPLITAAHTQFRFLLKTPLKLTAQSGAIPGQAAAISDVIISSTFTAPAGAEYSGVKSLMGSYGLVTRLMASVDRAREEILVDKSPVRQFRLKITPAEGHQLFAALITMASRDGYSQRYQLLDNNCATKCFDALDEVRPRPAGLAPMRGSLLKLRDEFIAPSLEALKARGWIDGPAAEVQPMNDEIRCFKADDTCRYVNR